MRCRSVVLELLVGTVMGGFQDHFGLSRNDLIYGAGKRNETSSFVIFLSFFIFFSGEILKGFQPQMEQPKKGKSLAVGFFGCSSVHMLHVVFRECELKGPRSTEFLCPFWQTPRDSPKTACQKHEDVMSVL